MKREELKKLNMTDEQIDYVMDENGKEVNAQKAIIEQRDQQITTLTTERDGLKSQVADRDKDIGELKKQSGNSEELNKKLTELQTKYDTETTELKNQIDGQARQHATERIFDKVEFTSEFAKKAAIAEFTAANLDFKDGAYVDADKYLEKMRADNPDAFKVSEPPKGDDAQKGKEPPKGTDTPKPQFTNPGTSNGESNKNDVFNFGFTNVRHSKQN